MLNVLNVFLLVLLVMLWITVSLVKMEIIYLMEHVYLVYNHVLIVLTLLFV